MTRHTRNGVASLSSIPGLPSNRRISVLRSPIIIPSTAIAHLFLIPKQRARNSPTTFIIHTRKYISFALGTGDNHQHLSTFVPAAYHTNWYFDPLNHSPLINLRIYSHRPTFVLIMKKIKTKTTERLYRILFTISITSGG